MASSQKTASGKWTCRVYIGMKDGKRQYKRFTADTKKDAERKANFYLLQNPIVKDECDYTVSEAITAYINSKRNILSPSTVAGYEKIKRNWLQLIMPCKIRDLTKELVQQAVNIDAATHSPKTVRNAVGLLVPSLAMFDYKVDVTLPQRKKVEITIPTDEELKTLCAEADRFGILAPVSLAAYMGLRRSEISALDLKKDFDATKCTLSISSAFVLNDKNRYVLKDTKSTESTRIVPVPSVVVPILADMVKKNKKMPNPDYIEKNFVELRDSVGLKHITFHSLRHYYASTLVVLNIPDFYAMKLMGHKNDQMLKRVYQHIRQDYMDEISQKMDSFYASKIAIDD